MEEAKGGNHHAARRKRSKIVTIQKLRSGKSGAGSKCNAGGDNDNIGGGDIAGGEIIIKEKRQRHTENKTNNNHAPRRCRIGGSINTIGHQKSQGISKKPPKSSNRPRETAPNNWKRSKPPPWTKHRLKKYRSYCYFICLW